MGVYGQDIEQVQQLATQLNSKAEEIQQVIVATVLVDQLGAVDGSRRGPVPLRLVRASTPRS